MFQFQQPIFHYLFLLNITVVYGDTSSLGPNFSKQLQGCGS
jgi:hypothetical protein